MNIIKNILHSLTLRHKKVKRILNLRCLPILAVFMLNIFICLPSAYAESSSSSASANSLAFLNSCKGCESSIYQLLDEFRTNFNDSILKVISVAGEYRDSIMQKLLPNSTNLLNSRKTADEKTSQQLSNLISFYLSGIEKKREEKRALGEDVTAIDDVPESANKDANFINSVFGDAKGNVTPALNTKDADLGTAVMNVDSLMGPLEYTDTQQILNAQKFLRMANSFSPPPDVIHISQHFQIPDFTGKNSKQPFLIIDLEPGDVKKIKAAMESDSDYIQYKMDYRASIAARTTFFNSLLRFYQERMKQKAPDGTMTPSLAKLEHDSVERRMTKDYYNQMSTAPLAEVEHEMLFTLIDIHHDLYLIRQQNEQIIALQALTGLQTSQLGSLLGKVKINDISKKIYCAAKDPKKENAPCKEETQGGGTGTSAEAASSIEKIQSSTPAR